MEASWYLYLFISFVDNFFHWFKIFVFLCHTYYHPQLWAKPKEKFKYQWGENQIITKFHRKVYKHLSLSSSLVIAPSPCPLPPPPSPLPANYYHKVLFHCKKIVLLLKNYSQQCSTLQLFWWPWRVKNIFVNWNKDKSCQLAINRFDNKKEVIEKFIHPWLNGLMINCIYIYLLCFRQYINVKFSIRRCFWVTVLTPHVMRMMRHH